MTDEQLPDSVPGFRFGGVAAGIKKDGALDLGAIVADEPAAAAAVLTRNRVRAAPVEIAQARVEGGRAQAILVNSGNANACTGKPGERATRGTTAAFATALGIGDELVLPASTGVIGALLPAEKIQSAIPRLVRSLAPTGWRDFARAIMTTDRGPKIAARTLTLGGKRTAHVLGIAKGAGMIHPNMATTLAFVVTDAAVPSAVLRRSLRAATDDTFNAITVDGETSTNDTIVALASGAAGGTPIRKLDRDARRFDDALREVLSDLAQMIVADGEGAMHVARIEVQGAANEAAARAAARRIATSLLVKTALHGRDPNWGRILSALGTAGIAFDPSRVEIRFDDVTVVKKGVTLGPTAEDRAREVMKRSRFTILVRLGPGRARAHYDTCDLGAEYVRINAGYRS